MSMPLLTAFFIGEIIGIFLLSRLVLQKVYPILKKICKTDGAVIFLISLIYFPGTFIHELSHYIVALILRLHPSEIQLLPAIEGKKVKLGHVLYEKYPHDFIRPILVGIAPLFGGLGVLWLIIQTNQFPGVAIWQTLLFGYLILTITANMFSSKQDLIDVGYLIPVITLVAVLLYFFPLQLPSSLINQLTLPISYFFNTLQAPLLFSGAIHAILVVLLFLIKKYL